MPLRNLVDSRSALRLGEKAIAAGGVALALLLLGLFAGFALHVREAHSTHAGDELQRLALMAAVAVAVVLTATVLAVRIHRSREAVRSKLDAALLELALRGRELGVLVASVQDLIFRTDAEGRLSYVNERWPAVTGRPVQAFAGELLALVVDEASRDAARRLFAPTGGDAPRRARLAVAAPGGALRHLDVAVTPLQADGHLAGFAGSAVDITDALRTEQRLIEQLAYNERLVDAMPLPISLVDAQGRLLHVNQAWEHFHGRRKADAIGSAACEPLRLAAADTALLRSGGSARRETTLRAGDGSTRDVVLTHVAVTDAAHGPALLTVTMDVSEFRDAERATRQARDLAEQASRAKSEFVANISHELRTPLQSILGFSELGRARSGSQPRLQGMFGDVHEAGQRMLALVNDLLDVSKIESRETSLQLQTGDLRDWVQSVVQELQPLWQAKRLLLKVDAGTRPLPVHADPLRLQQVVRNVLANAIKFSQTDSGIELRAGAGERGTVEIAVRDRGPGIPEAELEKVFEAFVQSSQTRHSPGGTGLGLAISRKIVQAHGGRIWAENAAGGGCVFRIVLPALRPDAAAAPAASLTEAAR